MLNKKSFYFIVAVLGVFSVLVLTSKMARAGETSSSMILDVQLAENTVLESVIVGEDHATTFRGRIDGLSGTCLPIQIFVDGERGAWWPVFRCLPVSESGEWTVRVPSEDGGRPISIHFHTG